MSDPHFYRMLDANPNGVIAVDPRDARRWNERGFGIFWAINRFFRGERRIANLEQINAWAVDIDDGTKESQLETIRRSPLVPTLVVETKRGFQVYWRAKNAIAEHWNAIVLDRLVPFFNADRNARDLTRILRVPGYFHQKDPANPFLVEKRYEHGVAYTEKQLVERFPYSAKVTADKAIHARSQREYAVAGSTFWDRVWSLDCQDALTRLSGSSAVSGERFSFHSTRRGTQNIHVDGKGTSAWIDAAGRIGSLSNGGPTIYQWLRWYGASPRDAVETIKQYFPEVGK